MQAVANTASVEDQEDSLVLVRVVVVQPFQKGHDVLPRTILKEGKRVFVYQFTEPVPA
jgi:hypothetical protein